MTQPTINPLLTPKKSKNPQKLGGWLFIGLVVLLFSTSILVPHLYQQYRGQSPQEIPPAENWVESIPTPVTPRVQQPVQRSAQLADYQFAEFQPAFTQASGSAVPPLPPTAEVNVSSQRTPRRVIDQTGPRIASNGNTAFINVKHHSASVDDLRRWPQPVQLQNELTQLAMDIPPVAQWTEQVQALVGELTTVQPMTANSADFILQSLTESAAEGKEVANASPLDERQQIRRVVYSLERRLDIWQAALAVLRNDPRLASQTDNKVLNTGKQLQNFLEEQEHGVGWIRVLKLADLDTAIEFNRRAEHVQDVYTAITNVDVSRQHREVFSRPLVEAYLVSLGGWAEVQRDLPLWLHELEQTEMDPQDGNIQELNKAALFWPASPLKNVRALSLAWQKHYRNANVRVAISEQFLNRMMPGPTVSTEPIMDQILGARVFGQTQTSSQVQVRLASDPKRLNLTLQAQGVVNSDTRSTSGPVTFISDGVSTFQAQKNITFDGDTIQTATAGVAASTSTQLRGLHTDYDDVPLIGNLVRRIALNEHNEQMPRANQIVRSRVASQSQIRFDSEIHQRMTAAESQVNKKLIGPLEEMSLMAIPIELRTTDSRCIARYRIAGPRQWGGYTPRPEAPATSWLSMQLHQSLVNNALAGLDLAGHTATLEELHERIQSRLGLKPTAPPEEIPEGVSITFADETPAEVRFDEGRIQIKLSIAELRTENRRWNDFQVTVFYAPEADGMQTTFARDGGVFLSGKQRLRLGDRIALAGIFSRAFGRSRPLSIVPERMRGDARLAGLTVAPVTVDKGWIGIALVPADKTAEVPTTAIQSAVAVIKAPLR